MLRNDHVRKYFDMVFTPKSSPIFLEEAYSRKIGDDSDPLLPLNLGYLNINKIFSVKKRSNLVITRVLFFIVKFYKFEFKNISVLKGILEKTPLSNEDKSFLNFIFSILYIEHHFDDLSKEYGEDVVLFYIKSRVLDYIKTDAFDLSVLDFINHFFEDERIKNVFCSFGKIVFNPVDADAVRNIVVKENYPFEIIKYVVLFRSLFSDQSSLCETILKHEKFFLQMILLKKRVGEALRERSLFF
jgi:hypothetical protein